MTSSPDLSADARARIVVLMACHNRASITQEFFASFIESNRTGFTFEFIVCDDGSTDGTSAVLESQPFPIKVVQGTGNLFWAKSMALAEAAIESCPDGVLWVNDDLKLNKDAFETLLDGMVTHQNSVLIGQVVDQDSEEFIYGGYRRLGRHPLKVQRVSDSDAYLSVDTFNGNFVYIPTHIRLAVGPIDSFYQHAYADIDYGYRVTKAGYSIFTLPRVVGTGFGNKITWPKEFRKKIAQQTSAKFNPTASQIHFFRNHTGRLWFLFLPFYLIRPFLKVLLVNSSKLSVLVKD